MSDFLTKAEALIKDWTEEGLVPPKNETELMCARQLDALIARCGWQPIETAPKDGAWALVYADGAINCAFVRGDGVVEDWTTPQCPNVIPEYVTHWMPLPAAPKPEDAEE